jgi:hypothetical protein
LGLRASHDCSSWPRRSRWGTLFSRDRTA